MKRWAVGLIARLCAQRIPVTVLAITDEEGAYADTSGLDRVRVPEQIEALDLDRSMIQRLGIPDRFVSEHEEELAAALLMLVKDCMQIIAPFPAALTSAALRSRILCQSSRSRTCLQC